MQKLISRITDNVNSKFCVGELFVIQCITLVHIISYSVVLFYLLRMDSTSSMLGLPILPHKVKTQYLHFRSHSFALKNS